MIVDRAVCPEKSLSLSWGFEPLHAMLPRSCWLLEVFGSVVPTNVSPMLRTRHQFSLRSGIASELVSHYDSWRMAQGFQQFSEELLSSSFIPSLLSQNI